MRRTVRVSELQYRLGAGRYRGSAAVHQVQRTGAAGCKWQFPAIRCNAFVQSTVKCEVERTLHFETAYLPFEKQTAFLGQILRHTHA